MVMNVCLPFQPHITGCCFRSLRDKATFTSATRVSHLTGGKQQRLFFTVFCAIPPRDVAIDFGKFKGCQMGTLPPGYLRWLIREGHDPSLAVWADHAKQVLQDPYYRDRVEWQKIEKLSSKGEVPKRGPSGIGASAKESMIALGWDLSDRNAWSKVNFSLLGTTAGGRIPRKDPPSPSSIPKASVAKRKTAVSRPSMEPNTYTFPSRLKLLGKSLDLPASYEKHSNTNAAENSRTIRSNLGASESESESEPTKSLSLREELLRRRQLRRERSASKSSMQPPTSGSAQHRFPGRDSLMQRARKRVDT